MTLPDFLGLGAQRAGTTWLDRVLRRHPELYLPERRKEVHFFDQHYSRGPEWYETFFRRAARSARYSRVGEITPRYLFDPRAPRRIHTLLPECKMLVLLRDPVTRLYSHYGLHVRDLAEARPFARFVREHGDAFDRGLYSRQLVRYLELFDRSQILVLIYEEVMNDKRKAVDDISRFLDVDPAPLYGHLDESSVNAAYVPRFPRLRSMARGVGSRLREHGADSVVNLAKRCGIPDLFGGSPLEPLSEEERSWLRDLYSDDVEKLEGILGKDLNLWKGAA